MERKLASIRKIDSIKPIKGADRIELAKIGGWHVVVKKDEFKPGDLCVYCEIDSVLPKGNPEFEFLAPRKYKVKTMKLRGVVSQGIAFPLSILNTSSIEGADVTELIGIVKYEPPIKTHMSGDARGEFPIKVAKTDEERVQNLAEEIEAWRDIPFVVTEKLDGTSATFVLIANELHVCSRNIDLKEDGQNLYWKIARQFGIEEKLRTWKERGYNIALQGEIVGVGIQNNPLGLSDQRLYIFNIWDLQRQAHYNYENLSFVCEEMGLDMVPTILEGFKIGKLSIDKLIGAADGQSLLNEEKKREGIVFRSVANHKDLSQFGKVSFKAVSNAYLLKEV